MKHHHKFLCALYCFKGWLLGSDGKASACNEGDLGSIPGSGRSPGEDNGNPLQYSCLENPTDREAWQAASPWRLQRVRHGWRDLACQQAWCQCQLNQWVGLCDMFQSVHMIITRHPRNTDLSTSYDVEVETIPCINNSTGTLWSFSKVSHR